MDPTRVVRLDPTRKLTACRASNLHWQLTLMCIIVPLIAIFIWMENDAEPG